MKKLIRHLSLITLPLALPVYADCTLQGDPDSPIRQWQTQANSCRDSAVAATNAIIEQLNRGDTPQAEQALQQALRQHPRFVPLKQLQQQSEQPFAAIAKRAQTLLQHWFDNYPQPVFNRQPPELETMPPLPELVKGEFETTPQFQQRVQRAQDEREATRQRLQQQYENEVGAYNRAVERHNDTVREAQQQRERELPAQRKAILRQAIYDIMGEPILTDPQYDADNQTFKATLQSSYGSWRQPVTISVPLKVAPQFKQAVTDGELQPIVNFDITNDTLTLKAIDFPYQNQTYAGLPASGTTQMAAVRVTLEEAAPIQSRVALVDTNAIETLQSGSEAGYFSDALKMEHDPQLAKLQQQRAELERQRKEALYQQQLAQQRKQLEVENQRIAAQLAQMGGETGQYEGLNMKTNWQFPRARTPQHDTIAVIFGSREYGKGIPIVPYALNDAKAVKQYAETTLGLPQSQIIFQENPTRGQMAGTLNTILPSRMKATGASKVLLYFSGHGMTADNDAMLLPSDSSPQIAKDTGYSRTQLLTQLASLDADHITVMLDACYTGTDKGGKALLEGKPVFTPPDVEQVPQKITLITASSGKQIAWMDKEKGHSLLTYHLLQGLSGKADRNNDRQISQSELDHYLRREVNRAALLLHNTEQTPEVKGREAIVARY
ncbi:caspase family protein [Ectothiorhodospiraceae bacterium BW-2]|nr:caspase family protein [Ectothiorhodospiraceae bacterium BW-2]